MSLKRREFLYFMGATVGALGAGCWGNSSISTSVSDRFSDLKFQPVSMPLPLPVNGLTAAEQQQQFSTYSIVDDLVLPEGYTYDVVATWGDPVGSSRFGYNNDYVSFVETAPGEGFLTVNFESSGSKTWLDTYPLVLGESLEIQGLIAAAKPTNGALTLVQIEADADRLAAANRLARELLLDQGLGVISVRREADGRWIRTFSEADRRISGISGLENDRYLGCTGPAAAIFRKTDRLGYDDRLGDRILGTFQNCAGGTTPWGTVLSAEENFQSEVIEYVWSDGSAIDPQQQPFYVTATGAGSSGVIFGLAGNKYGWVVEVDPRNPADYGTKHTWFGRYRHEALAVWAVAGKPLAVYSGCDRRGGHVYKFVSQGSVADPASLENSKLFEAGMLYGAKFEPDGTGTWIPLAPDTPVNPLRPSHLLGQQAGQNGIVLLPNPNPEAPSYVAIEDDGQAETYQNSFATLGDLYLGNPPAEKQGVILIDAHFAANAAGVTATARPEDTQMDPQSGTLYIAFTSGFPGNDGSPDRRIFQGPQGETPYDPGWIMKLQDLNNDPSALSFRWEMLALGGSPDQGGTGFSNPDNLEVDAQGNVWVVTDMGSRGLNQGQGNLGRYGNNAAWIIPTQGDRAGEAIPFATGPMECEICGIFMTPDQKTLFLAPQHPGEVNGMRQAGALENREISLSTTTGEPLIQVRSVPLGSNWPGKGTNDPPKPSVVAVRRLDGETIV
ncbi:MAG: PhoX family protein [Prochlorotrichaceae cyanobacterium]